MLQSDASYRVARLFPHSGSYSMKYVVSNISDLILDYLTMNSHVFLLYSPCLSMRLSRPSIMLTYYGCLDQVVIYCTVQVESWRSKVALCFYFVNSYHHIQ